jgi:hypothetical protein
MPWWYSLEDVLDTQQVHLMTYFCITGSDSRLSECNSVRGCCMVGACYLQHGPCQAPYSKGQCSGKNKTFPGCDYITVGYQVLMAVTIFWNMAPCNMVQDNEHFGRNIVPNILWPAPFSRNVTVCNIINQSGKNGPELLRYAYTS